MTYVGGNKCHEWGKSFNKSCYGETEPVKGPRYPGGPVPQENTIKDILKTISKPVSLLDITYLSQLRKDAHPSSYNGIHLRLDCSHWCVPGLPDIWNQLMYTALKLNGFWYCNSSINLLLLYINQVYFGKIIFYLWKLKNL